MDIKNKTFFIFDLDGTLAPSKSQLDESMAQVLKNLLDFKKVAIISGGSFDQFNTQFLTRLDLGTNGLKNLYLLPVTGTELYIWDDHWIQEYKEPPFSSAEKEKILNALQTSIINSEILLPEHTYGERIEDRGSQITFSALGQDAPIQEKSVWDPDHLKRTKIINILRPLIPEYPIHIGGMTSIDIGWDKGKALEKFIQSHSINKEQVLFFGDALYPEGNDFPAQEIGLECVTVSGPEDTRAKLENMLQSMA